MVGGGGGLWEACGGHFTVGGVGRQLIPVGFLRGVVGGVGCSPDLGALYRTRGGVLGQAVSVLRLLYGVAQKACGAGGVL